MVVCGAAGGNGGGMPEHLLLNPWRALGSYGPPSAADSTVWQPAFGGGAFAATTGVKRQLSDSDMDDVFDDSSSKGTPTQSNDSCQMLNRKKRRGIIEKRRRDRINNSLTELRRLVPTAFEKQGSAKLEKAEILQMTVDHLKMLHAKGFDAFSFDPHKFATDYHGIGFRECASEVARYLVTVEGMDIQDPLRLRLMSHLQCYSAQRELAAKQATTWNAFSAVPPPPPSAPSANPSHFPSSATTSSSSMMGHHHHHHQGGGGTSPPLHPHAHHPPPPPPHHHHHHQSATTTGDQLSCSAEHPPRLSLSSSDNNNSSGTSGSSHMRLVPHPPPPLPPPPTPSGSLQPMSSGGGGSSSMVHSIGQMQYHPVSLNINTHGFTSMSPSSYSPSSTTSSSQTGHSVKPYRPWGTELAY